MCPRKLVYYCKKRSENVIASEITLKEEIVFNAIIRLNNRLIKSSVTILSYKLKLERYIE